MVVTSQPVRVRLEMSHVGADLSLRRDPLNGKNGVAPGMTDARHG